jgi:ATP-dependent Zn protease
MRPNYGNKAGGHLSSEMLSTMRLATTAADGPLKLATAVHEAGHAVIGRALGLACGPATIIRDGNELGHAIVEDPLRTWQRGDGPRRRLLESHCITLYAGAEAEREILGTELVGDGADRDKAEMCIYQSNVRITGVQYLRDAAWVRYAEALRARARRLVRARREQIEAVAKAVHIHHHLSGEEINAAMVTAAHS